MSVSVLYINLFGSFYFLRFFLGKLKQMKSRLGFRSKRAGFWPCFWPAWTLPGFYACLQTQHAATAAKSFQSCPALCDLIDGSPPGSPVPGTLQARTLEWVAISFSNAWKWEVKVKSLSRVRPSATPWTAAHQAPPSMGFSRQEYWSRVPLPSKIMVGAQK